MKITAQELKVGMDVKFGNLWVKVDSIEKYNLKNGKLVISVSGMSYAATIRRSNGYKEYRESWQQIADFKALTKVSIR